MSDNPGFSLEEMKEIIKKSAFNSSLAVELVKLDNGRCELEVPIRPDLTQFHGYVHGAVVGAVADNACAWAAASVVGGVVTAEYKINFVAPAVGEKLIGRGQVIKASKRQIICRSEVFCLEKGREKLAAAAMATIFPYPG